MPRPPPDDDESREDVGSELDLEQVMEVEKRQGLSLDFKELLEDEDDEPEEDPGPGAVRRAGAPPPTARVGGGSLESESFLSRQDREALERAKRAAAAAPSLARIEGSSVDEGAPVVRSAQAPYLKLAAIALAFLLVVGGATFAGLRYVEAKKQAEIESLQKAQELLRQAEEDRLRRLRERAGEAPAAPPAAAPAEAAPTTP